VRPLAPLTCDECHHLMYAKIRGGTRFFAHAPNAPTCALALETFAYHLLKLELLKAAQDAGAHAEMEARGPDGTWRADVLASDPGGTWRMALEAQLATITAADITARTERMRADGVPSIWFSDRPRPPWLGTVPSVRLSRPDDSEGLVAAEGLMKFDGYWQDVPAGLVEFLGWVFAGRIVPYRPRVCVRDGPTTIWTAPRYIRAFDEYFAELERQAERDRRRQAPLMRQLERKRGKALQKNASIEAAAIREERPQAELRLQRAEQEREAQERLSARLATPSPQPSRRWIFTADRPVRQWAMVGDWLAETCRIVPEVGMEACQTLWREVIRKYREGELAEPDFAKVLALLKARMEALETARRARRSPVTDALLSSCSLPCQARRSGR
jgi:hypothetical protein